MLPTQQFLIATLGMALAAPLFAQSMPFLRYLGWFFLPLVVYGFVLTFLNPMLRSKKSNFLVSLLLLMVLLYAFGMLRTEGPLPDVVWKDFIRGCYFVLLAAVVIAFTRDPRQASLLLRWFLRSAAAVAVAAAVLGIVKYYLLLCGFHLFFVAGHNAETYPWGTSLSADINFFALSLLIGGLVLLYYWYTAKSGRAALLCALLLGLVVVVAAYTGSRRFWVAAPVAFIAQLLLYRYRGYGNMQRSRWGILAIGFTCAAVPLYLIFSVLAIPNLSEQALTSPPAQGEVQQEGVLVEKASPLSEQALTSPPAQGEVQQEGVLVEKASPSAVYSGLGYMGRIQSLLSEKENFGTTTRLERWRFAVDLIKQNKRPWLGSGFDYRFSFGCHFFECGVDDYPHNPLLSALLYGGIVAFGVSVAMIMYAVYWAVLGFRNTDESATISLALLVSLFFVLVSGDTFFSMPVFLAVIILARVAASHRPANEELMSKE